MKDFTVIMPCWIVNEELVELTKNAIDSLGEVTLILIDNASPIGGGLLRERADIYIRNRENLGYAKAINEGLKLARTKLIAITNNDIRVSPNWQEVAREVLEEPRTYSCHLRMTDYDVPFQYGQKTVYQGMERWCTGSFYVIGWRRPFFYDENFLNSYDDWDLFKRVRAWALQTAYTDKACYQHHHSFTQKQLPEHAENNRRNVEYFIKKWTAPAETLFAEEFPEQMKIPYSQGFNLDDN